MGEVANFTLLKSLAEVKDKRLSGSETKAADPQDEGNIGIMCSDQISDDDDEDALPPEPNDEDLEYEEPDNPTNSTSEPDRRLASTGLHEGVPYIIKNGVQELSWFGGWWDGTYVKNYIYPVYAHQHTKAEKMWLLKKVRGNTYTVKMHPDNGVSACWHLGWNSLIDRRMSAELKCSTGFPWEFRRERGAAAPLPTHQPTCALPRCSALPSLQSCLGLSYSQQPQAVLGLGCPPRFFCPRLLGERAISSIKCRLARVNIRERMGSAADNHMDRDKGICSSSRGNCKCFDGS